VVILLCETRLIVSYFDQGRWNVDSLLGAYINGACPLPAMRVIAGFKLQEGYYYISRQNSDIDIPEEVLQSIFPWLEKWIEEKEQQLSDTNRNPDLAEQLLVKNLTALRTIIAQDVAILQGDEFFHNVDIIHSAPFDTPVFLNYASSLRQFCENDRIPVDHLLSTVAPTINESLNTNFKILAQQLKGSIGNSTGQLRSELGSAIEIGFGVLNDKLDQFQSKYVRYNYSFIVVCLD
jgi:hypothetical protein